MCNSFTDKIIETEPGSIWKRCQKWSVFFLKENLGAAGTLRQTDSERTKGRFAMISPARANLPLVGLCEEFGMT